MSRTIGIRQPQPEDAADMARVHVASWGETYRGLMPDSVLDDPNFTEAREKQWTATLTNPRWSTHRTAMAMRDESMVGIAMAGPATEEPGALHLYVLYVLTAYHGAGAGSALLEAVLAPDEPATLWVADPNPRAQAFYRKHGFAPDGIEKVEDGVREVHMTRAGTSVPI